MAQLDFVCFNCGINQSPTLANWMWQEAVRILHNTTDDSHSPNGKETKHKV
jgi:hypothetical protein